MEPRSEAAIRDGVATGRLHVQAPRLFEPASNLPDGARSLLAHDATGRCAFFHEPSRLCAVHRDVGHPALPLACRQFPRVALLTRDAVSLTLSHYCPSAAALLFESPGPVTIALDPPGFPPDGEYDGLDAKDALPPMLRPGVLTTLPSYARFEARGISLLTRAAVSVDQAVSDLAATTQALALWTSADGEWETFADRRLAEEPNRFPQRPDPRDLWGAAVGSVPDPARRPTFVDPSAADRRLFQSLDWELAPPVKRYLAAKLFASWSAYQGDGLAAIARLVETALAVLQVECARRASDALDRSALLEAVRRADRLLVHLAEPAALARRLGLLSR